MPDLFTLQNDFQDYLLDKTDCIKSSVIDVAPVSATARLNIYKNGYYLRLMEALQQDYEVLCAMVGEDEFDELCRDYIDEYPSHFRSIRWYGKTLSDFLKQKTDHPVLIEMAQFEWLLTEAFDAPESNIVLIEEIAAIPPEAWPTMQFELHPSLRQLELYSNAVSIWQSYKEDNSLQSAEYSDTPLPWIIWRKEYDIQFCSLTPPEYDMLQTMLAGLPFRTLCERLLTWVNEENAALEAALFLKRLILDQLVTEVTFS